MAFDYKKAYRELYLPPQKPQLLTVPEMQFAAVRGTGNPNSKDGEYKAALAVLYVISYTIKMSRTGSRRIDGYFDYVVPPLEGFWWQDGSTGMDYARKDALNWISVIRLPDFVTPADFDWAKETAAKKKGLDCSRAELFTLAEGECVQIMHLGSYDDEPATVQLMDAFALANGWQLDFSAARLHHEIYLSDPRKSAPEKRKTVIRHPVRRAS